MDLRAMNILLNIFGSATERLTSFEVHRKRGLLLLRWTLFLTLLALVVMGSQDVFQTVLLDTVLGILLLLNLFLLLLPRSIFRTAPFEFSLGLFDAALLSYVLYQVEPSGVLCLFFFVLLLITATSTRITHVLLGAGVIGFLYLLVSTMQTGASVFLSISHLMVIPLFYSTSLYFGYQVLQIRNRQAQTNHVYRERQELKIVLDVLESITSSLDFHSMMYQLSTRIAEVVNAVRCSVILVEEGVEDRGFVVASSTDPKLKMLPLDLSKYPEVQAAIRRKNFVLIKDVEKSELLRPYVQNLLKLNFRSRLVLPVLYQETVIGTLILSASRKRSFTSNDLRLCRAIASAAASAIKNSVLYQEQKETAAQLRSLFDNSPELILQLDSMGNVQEVSRTVERMTGRTYADVLSLRFESLIQGLPPVSELLDTVPKSKEPLVYEGTLRTAGGQEMDLSVTAGSIEGSGGGLILIAQDVTERKKAAARLLQSQKLSHIGEIVASVAHELNNPLTGVMGFSHLLAQKDSEGKFKRQIDRIIQSADQCQKIVRNLLSFSRPSKAEKKPLGLNGILDKTLDLLEAPLAESNILVRRDYDRDLPYIVAEFHEIQQVLTNLIINAQQAMSGRSQPGQLFLKTYSHDGRVCLEVADNGPGIAPEVLPRIFDPFFSTKEEGKGTGLGLSVSFGIVRDHGGELLVKSQVEKGTTFTAIFPAASDAAHPGSEREEAVGRKRSTGRRILAVEDEPVIMDLYVDLLGRLGHSVDTAGTGMEALRKLRQQDYDLVLSDIKMPKMSGIEFYEKAVEAKPRMRKKFVFMTGDVNSLGNEQLDILQDVPCLLKPVNLRKIERAIEALLQGRRPPTDFPRPKAAP